MSERTTIQITRDNLDVHPAFEAWATIAPGTRAPSSIATLQRTRKNAVFRLEEVGPGGAPVIAKRCSGSTGRLERAVYERVLARLPIRTVECYGWLEEGDSLWLFLENVGGMRFTITLDEHRLLASRWLALMHTLASEIAEVNDLPDREASYHLALLCTVRDELRGGLANPLIGVEDRSLLEAIITQCDALERMWMAVVEACAAAPRTLVHGDFRAKNVRVGALGKASDLAVIDWEMAGRGAPATDLASTRAMGLELIDVDTYCAVARDRWPALTAPVIRRLVNVGRVFRRLAAIAWSAPGLRSTWPQRSVACMRIYRSELADDMRALCSPDVA